MAPLPPLQCWAECQCIFAACARVVHFFDRLQEYPYATNNVKGGGAGPERVIPVCSRMAVYFAKYGMQHKCQNDPRLPADMIYIVCMRAQVTLGM